MPESAVAASVSDPVAYLGHDPESLIFDGEAWKIICSCAWECWGIEEEEGAWEEFNDHVFDDVNTALRRLRDKTKAVVL